MKVISRDTYFSALDEARKPYHDHYRAMYTSELDAVICDPLLMRIPLDDHMVHRGDGAFEMCKSVNRGIYNFDAHVERLERTVRALGIPLPVSVQQLADIVCETLRISGLDDAAIRIYVSRGPGSFGVSPADCPQTHLYVAVSKLQPGFMEMHPEGARVGVSEVPVKPGMFATLKHCNYLPNVLMKKEAIGRGLDFVVGRDHEGFLTEGPTENFGIITSDGQLLFPLVDRVLEGTTMGRVLALADRLRESGLIRSAGYGRIHPEDVYSAAEALIVGTTTDVTFVSSFDDRTWSRMGPTTQALREQLIKDIQENADVRLTF